MTPCPAIQVHHQQATSKKQKGPKDNFIRNGKGQASKVINKKKYFLEDTSTFDSIVEIVTFAYKHIKDFQIACNDEICSCQQSNNLCFLKLIIDCCKAKNLLSFYNSRALYLYKYAKVQNDYILCSDSAGELFSKLLGNHYCLKKYINCKTCGINNTEKLATLNIFLNTIIQISDVQKEVNDILLNKNQCNTCKDIVTVNYEFGTYLALDLECSNYSTFLNVIPKKIVVHNITYILTGLIAHEGKEKRTYIGYCKKMRDLWSKLQSIKRKVEDVKKIPKVNVSIIFYVKIN